MEQIYDTKIPPHGIMRPLANQAGSIEKLPYLKDDIKNHLHKCGKKQAKGSDADAVLAYLREKK